jgi:hypothetical protein
VDARAVDRLRCEWSRQVRVFESGLQPFQDPCEGSPLIRPYKTVAASAVFEQRRDSGWRRCDEGDRDLLAYGAWTDRWGSVSCRYLFYVLGSNGPGSEKPSIDSTFP